MISFLKKLIVFPLFLFIPFISPAAVMIRSGEYRSLASAIKEQRDADHAVLFQWLFGGFENAYKRLAIATLHPSILTVGGSPMHQYRSNFFKPDANFYNGAFAASGFEDYTDLISTFDP